MEFEQLKLSNQLCFPVYAASRLITREYLPHLNKLGITYPQYLVLLVLWETDKISVNEIASKLILNTNTITPLLKRMESQGIIKRNRSDKDERKVMVSLTTEGKDMQIKASTIPTEMACAFQKSPFTFDKLMQLRDNLKELVEFLKQKNEAIDK
jgi:MarR family transcriptional regulator, organic hydroperoxide resistance regulator